MSNHAVFQVQHFRCEVFCNSGILLKKLLAYYEPFSNGFQEGSTEGTAFCAPQSHLFFCYEAAAGLIPSETFTPIPPSSPEKPLKESFRDMPDGGRAICKNRSGVMIHLYPNHTVIVGPLSENPNQVVNVINQRFAESCLEQGYVLAHAGAVQWGEGCLALTGPGGRGKSTGILWLMKRGARFTSNDRLLVKPSESGTQSAQVLGVPKLPRVNPGTLLADPDLTRLLPQEKAETYRHLPERELRVLEEKYDVPVQDVFGPNKIAPQCDLRAFLLLDWDWESPQPTRMDALDDIRPYLPLIYKDPGPYRLTWRMEEQPDYDQYARALAGVPFFRVSGGVSYPALLELISSGLRLDSKVPFQSSISGVK